MYIYIYIMYKHVYILSVCLYSVKFYATKIDDTFILFFINSLLGRVQYPVYCIR